jgi:hypothetical protein
MREHHAQIVLLIRAFEEEDLAGGVLSCERRTEATRLAREQAGDECGDVLYRRAALLVEHLTGAFPTLPRLLRLARLRFVPAPAVVGTALGAGLLTNALGPHREINLLSVPLLALLAWNALAYILLAACALGLIPSTRGLTTWLFHGILNRLRRWKLPARGVRSDAGVVSAAVARFVDLWRQCASRLLAARARVVLHVGAIAFAAGVIGGMYLRGLAFEYQATWESTFLEAGAVQTLLNWVLGPAASVLGVDVPDVAPLRGPTGGGHAAPWIHLFAMTAVLVVLLPRTVLATFHGGRARRIAADLPLSLEEGYFRRVLAEGRGTAGHVDVVPYSFEPDSVASDRLKSVLHDFFGARADVRIQTPVAYGEEWVQTARRTSDAAEGEHCFVVVFSLAQSPEAEVHGRFIEQLKAGLGRGVRLLVLVDAAKYRRRVATPERWTERARAWQRVVQETGPTAAILDLEQAEGVDGVLDAMASALWPAGETGRA